MKKYRQSDTWAPGQPWSNSPNNADFAEWERKEPMSSPSWGRHLGMALSVACCWGVAIGLIILAIKRRQGDAFEVSLNEALFWFVIVFASTLAGGIGIAALDFKSTLRSIERIVGKDLDGDGKVGKEQTRVEVTIQDADNPARPRIRYLTVALPPEQVRVFAQKALRDQSVSERTMVGSGKPFLSLNDYKAFRDDLILHNFAHRRPGWPTQGWALNSLGMGLMAKLAQRPTEEEETDGD